MFKKNDPFNDKDIKNSLQFTVNREQLTVNCKPLAVNQHYIE